MHYKPRIRRHLLVHMSKDTLRKLMLTSSLILMNDFLDDKLPHLLLLLSVLRRWFLVGEGRVKMDWGGEKRKRNQIKFHLVNT